MPSISLDDRALILLAGPDAEHFLQNIVTTDLDSLVPGEAKPGALLSPQGKILFDFLVSRDGPDRLRLDCRKDIAADFVRRLTLYKLRAKVEIAVDEQAEIATTWQASASSSSIESKSSDIDSTPSQTGPGPVRDTRFRDIDVQRVYGGSGSSPDRQAWIGLRIDQGIAESGSDYVLGDAFPHDVLLDELGGVGFRKGCYVGQEVVSRMQHRGTARRRVLIVSAETPLPAEATELTVGGKSVGVLGSVSGMKALSIARIDKVKSALDSGEPIVAGAIPVTVSIPTWASFTFPQNAVEEG